MKVIAKIDSDVYLCQVRHAEIEKYLGLYYNKMGTLKVGDEVDMGQGYNFFHQTQDALKKTEEFITSNKKVIEMIVTGISVMTRGDKEDEQQPC